MGQSPRSADMSDTDHSGAESPRSAASVEGSPKRDPARVDSKGRPNRRRLASNAASMRTSERALARRRLIAQPNSHTVVLEALTAGKVKQTNKVKGNRHV